MALFIKGIGLTNVREAWDKGLEDLAIKAAQDAIQDAEITKKKIDKIYVSSALAETLQNQESLASKISSALGLQGKSVVTVREGGASGGIAIHLANQKISAMNGTVLVVGVEKLMDALWSDILQANIQEESWEYLGKMGATTVALEAMLLRLYMKKFDVEHEEIAKIIEISQENASYASHAEYPFPISVEKVMKSPIVADPLRLFELAGVGDGAAAAVVSSEKGEVELVASETATDKFRICERESLLSLEGVRRAARKAYEKAGVSVEDIDLFELFDTSSIMGILEIEALGLAEKGKGYEMVKEEKLTLNGTTPINSFGGLKGRGHPIGATGVYQIVEATKQLRRNSKENQIDNINLALTLSLSGIGSHAVVNLLRRGEENA